MCQLGLWGWVRRLGFEDGLGVCDALGKMDVRGSSVQVDFLSADEEVGIALFLALFGFSTLLDSGHEPSWRRSCMFGGLLGRCCDRSSSRHVGDAMFLVLTEATQLG